MCHPSGPQPWLGQIDRGREEVQVVAVQQWASYAVSLDSGAIVARQRRDFAGGLHLHRSRPSSGPRRATRRRGDVARNSPRSRPVRWPGRRGWGVLDDWQDLGWRNISLHPPLWNERKASKASRVEHPIHAYLVPEQRIMSPVLEPAGRANDARPPNCEWPSSPGTAGCGSSCTSSMNHKRTFQVVLAQWTRAARALGGKSGSHTASSRRGSGVIVSMVHRTTSSDTRLASCARLSPSRSRSAVIVTVLSLTTANRLVSPRVTGVRRWPSLPIARPSDCVPAPRGWTSPGRVGSGWPRVQRTDIARR